MSSNVQVCNEKARALYCVEGAQPLLQQICQLHRITIREFAGLFKISKAYAENIIKHRVFPTMELGISICRYFEVSVEDLFAWRIDDHGMRRPLLVLDPKTNIAYRIDSNKDSQKTMTLVRERIRVKGEQACGEE